MKKENLNQKLSENQKKLMSLLKIGDNKAAIDLINSGCDPNFTTEDIISRSPLYVVALRDDVDMVRFLIEECGVEVTKEAAAFFSLSGNFSVGHYLGKKLYNIK